MIGGTLPRTLDTITPTATRVVIGDDEVLYIYCDIGDLHMYPVKQLGVIKDEIGRTFRELFPNTKIIVGFYDLKFTAITKKQEFGARLDGSIP